MSDPRIRRARPDDLAALTALYNHYVLNTAVTFDLQPYTPETRRPWLEQFADTGRYQLFCAEQDGRVVGYAGSMRFRVKAAYDPSVETTLYLEPNSIGRRLGHALYVELFGALQAQDVHRAYAGVTLPNDASLALHRRFGFSDIGVFREVGRKFDRWHDVLWLEKPL